MPHPRLRSIPRSVLALVYALIELPFRGHSDWGDMRTAPKQLYARQTLTSGRKLVAPLIRWRGILIRIGRSGTSSTESLNC